MNIRAGWMHEQYEVLLDDNKTYCYPYHIEVKLIEEKQSEENKKAILEKTTDVVFINGFAFNKNDSLDEMINKIKYLLEELNVQIEEIEL